MTRWWVPLIVIGIAACGRGSALRDLPYAPGAIVVGETSFVGEMFGFPRSAWEQVELRVERPYEQVRDFYAQVAIRGWTSTFESESTKGGGRVFNRFLTDARRRQFYVITVEDRPASRDTSVLLRRGLAK
ncbi:MAG: hypothetical protein ACT4PY_12145 [Armatimonadota bacterium]